MNNNPFDLLDDQKMPSNCIINLHTNIFQVTSLDVAGAAAIVDKTRQFSMVSCLCSLPPIVYKAFYAFQIDFLRDHNKWNMDSYANKYVWHHICTIYMKILWISIDSCEFSYISLRKRYAIVLCRNSFKIVKNV